MGKIQANITSGQADPNQATVDIVAVGGDVGGDGPTRAEFDALAARVQALEDAAASG